MSIPNHLTDGKTLLTVLGSFHKQNHRKYLRVQCMCGTIKDIREDHYKSNKIKSCGCYNAIATSERKSAVTHGCSKEPLYLIWCAMLSRCYNSHNKRYPDYGGRGITVCDEWRNSYVLYKSWALNNGWKPGLQIDREKNDGNYSPSNCRCVPQKINARNKRNNTFYTYNGKTATIPEWAEITGISKVALYSRMDRNWQISDAFTKPMRVAKILQQIPGGHYLSPVSH